MRNAFCIVAALCLINISMISSQDQAPPGLPSQNKCADFNFVPVYPFNKELDVGLWFLHQMFDDGKGVFYDCYVLFSPRLLGISVSVTETFLNNGLPLFSSEGVTTYSSDGKGIFYYESPDAPEYNGVYYVLGTDSFTYTVVVSCTDIDNGSVLRLYVMSRLPIVLPFIQKKIDAILKAAKLNEYPRRTFDIKKCPAELLQRAGGGGLPSGLLSGLLNVVTSLLNMVTGLLGGVLGVVVGLLG